MDEKKVIRLQMHEKRATLKSDFKKKYDTQICERIWAFIVSQSYQTVHCYLPIGTEIDILPLIQQMLKRNITVVTPKTLKKRQLEHRILTSLDELETGLYGTQHPINPTVFTGKYDLIIVPGLAFSEDNYRLGYGGGYYDSFLAQHPSAYQLGVAYPFQKLAYIPTEEHDAQLDAVWGISNPS